LASAVPWKYEELAGNSALTVVVDYQTVRLSGQLTRMEARLNRGVALAGGALWVDYGPVTFSYMAAGSTKAGVALLRPQWRQTLAAASHQLAVVSCTSRVRSGTIFRTDARYDMTAVFRWQVAGSAPADRIAIGPPFTWRSVEHPAGSPGLCY
jgi:hypothetical protein